MRAKLTSDPLSPPGLWVQTASNERPSLRTVHTAVHRSLPADSTTCHFRPASETLVTAVLLVPRVEPAAPPLAVRAGPLLTAPG